MFLGLGLAAMWVFYSLRFAFTGEPAGESQLVLPAASVHLGYVLDLAFVVPVSILAAALLWQRAPWGYVLATVVLTFGTVYQLDYMATLVFRPRQAYRARRGSTLGSWSSSRRSGPARH